MVLVPLKQAITNNDWKQPRLIATDMDGTLTQQGKFTASLLQSLEDLSLANIPVLIVTGRSAGWVSGLATYLPVAGAIAENGGLFYLTHSNESVALTPISNLVEHRQQLAEVYHGASCDGWR